jgi:ATP-dependent 26S proteasome regulatory subunit
VITIATANDPLALDNAILKRPGRFDRVALFANPTPQLRQQYFAKMLPGLGCEDLLAASEKSDGFSFAQLREAFIISAQAALTEGRDVRGNDLIVSICSVRNTVLIGSLRTSLPGFAAPGKR